MGLLDTFIQSIQDLNPEWTKDRLKTAAGLLADFTPVVGDVKAGYDMVDSARQGNYGEAALNGIGLLPFVPAMGGIVGKAGKIVDADQNLAKTAKKAYGTTSNIKEAGYILPDGAMLDFSGRHYSNPSEWRYLAGQRNVDHRELPDSVHALLPKNDGGSEGMRLFMNQANAVRNQPNVGFDTTFVPSDEQLMSIMKGWRGNRDAMYVDATHPDTFDVLKSFEVERPTVEKLRGLLEDAYKGYTPKDFVEPKMFKPQPVPFKNGRIIGVYDSEEEANKILKNINTKLAKDRSLASKVGVTIPEFKDFAVAPFVGSADGVTRYRVWGSID